MNSQDYRDLRDRISDGFSESKERQAEIKEAIALVAQRTEVIEATSKDQETRIRALEKSKWRLAGFISALSAGAPFVADRIFGVSQ